LADVCSRADEFGICRPGAEKSQYFI